MDILIVGIGGLLALLLFVIVFKLLTASVGEETIEEVKKEAERENKI